MDKRIKARWLRALRSGKYEQGARVLRTSDNKFCCLGVLCDLHAKSTKSKWSKYKDGAAVEFEYFGEEGTLPDVVVDWAGLAETNPGIDTGRTQHGLVGHNDGAGTKKKSFLQIADLIEQYL